MTTDNPQNAPTGMDDQPGTETQKPEMCCDGQQTAEEHRHNSPDGKCCIDN